MAEIHAHELAPLRRIWDEGHAAPSSGRLIGAVREVIRDAEAQGMRVEQVLIDFMDVERCRDAVKGLRVFLESKGIAFTVTPTAIGPHVELELFLEAA